MAAFPAGKSLILKILNALNNTFFTPDQLVFSLPSVALDPDTNTMRTKVVIRPATALSWFGPETLWYDRRNLSKWANDNAPGGIVVNVNGISKISELLILLNNTYGANFTTDDFAEGLLPTGPYPMNFTMDALPTSYEYAGGFMVTLSVGLVALDQVIVHNDLGDIASFTDTSSGSSGGGSSSQSGGTNTDAQ